MSRGPKAVSLDLSEQEQGEIKRLLRRHGTGQALVSRLRIILACCCCPLKTGQGLLG